LRQWLKSTTAHPGLMHSPGWTVKEQGPVWGLSVP
jgi:hypothetical protein